MSLAFDTSILIDIEKEDKNIINKIKEYHSYIRNKCKTN